MPPTATSLAPPAASAVPRAGASNRAIAAWLLACCALVFAMVVVGGVTRLTHSGLSIVEWQPIVGTLPPLDEAAWQDAFEKYKLTPEYKLVNAGMALDEFKGIFWWEYFHRLLGRLIGVAFLVPFLWFLLRRRIPDGYGWKLAGIFLLGGLQGAMGWYMVKSGLVDDPRVSQFRLTAHLALAIVIFGAMQWVAMSLLRPANADGGDERVRSARRWAHALAALVFAMILTGGFVAGIRAGFAYNTFPLMNGHVVPPEIMMLEPWWRNFFWNMATVQFDHRLGAWLLAFLVPVLWWKVTRARAPDRARTGAHLMLGMLAVQIALGIATLVYVVPLPLAAAHQAGAVLLFAFALDVAHALRAAGREA
ncbi:cytochrome c oxidase assembly protein subunit 15 [Burkholderiales bacterium]|nr:cytochrome c oxidase assembly protein subunit 15 [Burkholderiales bacterium]